MARGYLGKISAVISANTGDYVRKLNESAKETSAFARTVQQTLGRASSEASKSLEGIYTPLQKVERALRAAASQKLAFRGFDGAIRDVQSLQAAIAKLTDKKTIDLVVKTSGVGSLDELKRTIGVLRNQDVTIGVAGLRQQRAAIGNTNNFVVSTAVRDEAARLDAVIEALERIDAESLKKISIQVEDAQLTTASNQFRRLSELSTQVGAPLAKLQSEFSGLSATVQAQFIPALAQAQNSYEQFQQRIQDNTDIAASEFRGLVADVSLVENAISRLRETAAAGGRLFTGEELTFVRPQAVDELNRLAAAQQRLAAAPAEVRGSSSARELLADGQVLREQIDRISARIERLNAQGLDIRFSQAGLDIALRRLEEVRRLTEELAAGSAPGDSAETAAIARRAAAESDFIAESQRLREQAFADTRAREEAESQRRLAAESDFIAESQRLREQAFADTRAREEAEAQRRLAAESEFIAESQRLREQAIADTRAIEEADAKRRAETASRFLQVDQQGSDIASNEGRSTPLTGNRDPRTRLIAQLGQETGDLRNRLRGVGETLAGDLGPTVDNLTTRFQNLARAGVGIAADRVQQLRRDIASLNAALDSRQATGQRFAESFGGAGRAGLSLGVDERSLRGIGAQVEFVQGRLSALGQEVRGPVIAALDTFRARAQQLFEGGAIDTTEGRRELQRLREELTRTLSAAGGGSVRRITEQLRRVGDVGRGSFGNLGLAVQQAAFAFDDFFSVTGGLDQRIRAAGNNISQLGFILGGTWGLGVGIAISVGTQFTLMLIDWYNEGRKTEDRLKSLNSTLEKQKNTVEQLAEAYGKVAERIREAGAGTSDASRREAEIRKQVDDVRSRQREARQQRILGASPEVQDARAAVAARERELGEASTAAARVRAQLRLDQDRRRLRREEQRALAGGGRPGRDEIAETVRRIAPEAGVLFSRERREAVLRDVNARLAAAGNDPQRQLDVLRRARQTQASISSGFVGRNIVAPNSEEVLVALDQLIARLESSEQGAKIDKALSGITRNALRIADAMEGAWRDIEAAFDGVSGASAIEAEISAFSESLAQFVEAVKEATERGDTASAAAFSEDVNAIKSHISALKDAAASIRVFGTELQRLSESVSRDVAALEQRAEEARRNDIEQGTADSRRQREGADRDLRAAREAQRQFEDTRASAVERFEQDAIRNNDPRFRRIREIDAMLSAPMGGVGADGTRGGTAEERRAARDERRALQRDIDNSIDNDPEVRAARKRADDATRQAQRAASEDRGRELSLTDAQRARREADRQAADIQAFFERDIGFGRRGVLDVAGRNAALNRLAEDQLKQVAPALAGFREERINAALQGPSRAALNVTDAATMEGQRELNRLLRGDDSAKDVNLVELQKQSELLQGVIDAINEQAGADVVEIRG